MTQLAGGHLTGLTQDECWQLLATRPVGRLAWTGPTGPVVLPVNHAVVDRTIRLRTTAYGSIAREVDDAMVAFEVDELDDGGRRGWSVLVQARARLSYPGGPGWRDGDVDTWPSGPRPVQVVLEPRLVSGRRLAPVDGG